MRRGMWAVLSGTLYGRVVGVERGNEASRFLTEGVPTIGDRPVEEMRDAVTDDFRREDRRRLVGLPDNGAEGFVDGIEALFELGRGTPTFSVVQIVATRGQRLALAHNRIEYPDGIAIELLSLVQLAADLGRMEIEIDFDVDDVEAALAELDRLHAAIEADSSPTR